VVVIFVAVASAKFQYHIVGIFALKAVAEAKLKVLSLQGLPLIVKFAEGLVVTATGNLNVSLLQPFVPIVTKETVYAPAAG
jgi:hypothetical protein